MKNIPFLLIIIFLQTSCSNSQNKIDQNPNKYSNSLNIIIQNTSQNSESLWENNKIFIIDPKNFSKITYNNITIIHIDFLFKNIIIETTMRQDPKAYLHKAIVIALLMNNDFSDFDFNSQYSNFSRKEPLLYGQVLDHHGVPVRHQWRANKFADYLLKTKLKTYYMNINQVWSIKIPLKFDRSNKRAHKYLNFIYKASKKYNIDKSLILAIIEAESNFNPYAISSSKAVGLMQIVQNTAGRDVFKMQGKLGSPSKKILLNPEKNIDIGTAYLSLLRDTYLSAIINPISKKYATIASYHGGVTAMLEVFSRNQIKAFQIINHLHPDDVYQLICKRHSSLESRRYLFKVYHLEKAY
ncbi:membrane-bound lytic murein transglycosylase C [Wigglesworthia glossinidia endosymbiont of Glossina morsitans morsitans (Yale colony)]|uniref:peptidoglycan lytic exotransglycosylase n=1 Tax=Wigglesworthia glossinidia endosymbiont of Glossina morsitans morsitans (Yale colony) TaxID=1142511 RepID=H6Q5N5_WIGGL|nr:membrane-bound lytic murein transglycosylase MltC [Wigglesworthia glossinidia]AFA40939.1 membrane-bound lytic murein transglycosylase C [Wigglesworthia glossinidia endosymbiont of Glossina morsitans morsitans (Yale colony)]